MARPARIIKRVAVLLVSLVVRAWDLVRAGLLQSLTGARKQTGVVLYYHAVKRPQRQRFARQMDELVKRASAFPAGSVEAMRSDARNVAVTFDDGFRSVIENAVPELEKRSIPFTVFVPSGCLGERPSWVVDPNHPSWEERVLTAAELRGLARQPLATLGSHSITHPNLVALEASRAQQELVRSKAELEAAAGVSIDLFSFPHGAHNAALVDQARRAGYKRVFTIEPANVDGSRDLFTIGRVAVDPDDWPLEFDLKIVGAYRWRRHLQQASRTI